MREVKYRANIKGTEDVHDVKAILFGNVSKDVIQLSMPYGNEEYMIDEVNLMQYTGIKDKNGREIYEGYICRYSCGETEWIAEVVFYHGMFTFPVKEEPLGRHRHIHNILEQELEVLGNLYENPELI